MSLEIIFFVAIDLFMKFIKSAIAAMMNPDIGILSHVVTQVHAIEILSSVIEILSKAVTDV